MRSPLPERHDIYARIHKGLRAFLSDTLVALGRMDPLDACDVRDTLARLDEVLAFCEAHLEAEDAFVHPALESRSPGAALARITEHVAHVRDIGDLRMLARQLAAEPSVAGARALYRRFAAFVAENLLHMEQEEQGNNAALWALFSDPEIRAIEARIVASHAPAQTMHALRWMLPSVHHGERLFVLEGLRQAPPPVLQGALGLARVHLRAADVAKLERDFAQREPEATPSS
jgi:hypothetical protein